MSETIISPGYLIRENDISFVQPAPVGVGGAIIGPTVKGPVEIPTTVTSYGEFLRKFGAVFTSGTSKQEFLTSLAVKNYFDQGGNSLLVTRVVSGSANWTSAESTFITAEDKVGTAPFVLETIGKGAIYNNSTGISDPGEEASNGALVLGSEDNLRWEVSNVNPKLGTFSLLVRRGDDNTRSKIILETYNGVTLDPNSENYIEKIIGNQVATVQPDGDGANYINVSGEYPNRSNYVRVKQVNLQTLNYVLNDGVTVGKDTGNASYSASLPIESSGSFYDGVGSVAGGNFFHDISTINTQGLTGEDYTAVIGLLGNKEEYRFNIITAPGLIYQNDDQGTAINSLISLAEDRGDCIVIIDLVNYGAAVSTVTAQSATVNSSYAAAYWPWVQMRSETGRDVWAPASTVIPGAYAFTDNSSAPWFAPAGFKRGGTPGVIQPERRLSKPQKNALYAAKVNPINTLSGQGPLILGQKTLQTRASALDRVNVRRLLIELKEFIGNQAANLIFEQNTIATRNRFKSRVEPYLESVVQNEGLYGFRVVMDDTNNPADVVDRNQIVGQIYIQPTRTIEYVLLDFIVEPTGVSFG